MKRYICDVMQDIINQLKEKNIPLAEYRMSDYHFHEFYFRVNADPEIIKTLQIYNAKIVDNSIYCDCHWSKMEFKKDQHEKTSIYFGDSGCIMQRQTATSASATDGGNAVDRNDQRRH